MLLTEFDEKAFKKDTYKDGYDAGYGNGVEERNKDIATRMIGDGMSFETISKYTGLSLKEIKSLK